jgi:hypothetical protein
MIASEIWTQETYLGLSRKLYLQVPKKKWWCVKVYKSLHSSHRQPLFLLRACPTLRDLEITSKGQFGALATQLCCKSCKSWSTDFSPPRGHLHIFTWFWVRDLGLAESSSFVKSGKDTQIKRSEDFGLCPEMVCATRKECKKAWRTALSLSPGSLKMMTIWSMFWGAVHWE